MKLINKIKTGAKKTVEKVGEHKELCIGIAAGLGCLVGAYAMHKHDVKNSAYVVYEDVSKRYCDKDHKILGLSTGVFMMDTTKKDQYYGTRHISDAYERLNNKFMDDMTGSLFYKDSKELNKCYLFDMGEGVTKSVTVSTMTTKEDE